MKKLKGSFANVLGIVWKYKFTTLCLILFLVVSHLLGVEHLNQRVIQYASAFSFVFLLITLAKTKYTFPITILFALLVTIDVYFAYEFGGRMTLGVLASVMETNVSEIQSMSSTILPLGLFVFVCVFAIIYLSQRELKKSIISRKVSLGIFLAFWLLCIPALLVGRIAFNDRAKRDFQMSKFGTVNEHIGGRAPLIIHNLTTLGLYLEEVGKLKDYKTKKRHMPEGVMLTEKENLPEKIFLVIGESVFRNHMSLYHYSVKTTPYLDSLAKVEHPKLDYYNGIATATLTRNAVRIAFSFSTPNNIEPFFENHNLVEMANLAGYETIWISNQDRIGLHDTYVGLVSSCADREYYSKEVGAREDFDLIPIAKQQLVEGKKQLIVIHINGSHLSYYDRLDDADRIAIGGSGSVADYDASIHHTDRVLAEVCKLQQEKSLMIYVPDHGEVIGYGHGFMNPTKEQLDIPFVSVSKGYTKANEIVQKYVDKDLNAINNSNLVYVVSELMGYSFSPKQIADAVESGKYIYHSDTKPYLYESVADQFITD